MKTAFTLLLSISLTTVSLAQLFTESQKIIASDRDTDDRLGWCVDIDGNFAIAGAYGDDFAPSGLNMGSVYVYEKIGFEWTQIQKLTASDQENYDRFGWTAAIDGDVIVVGAYGEDHNEVGGGYFSKAGSAYIFERDGDGDFVEVQKIVADDRAPGNEFGFDVAVHGNTIVVGAHNDDKDEFGVGYYYHSGSAYIFDRGDDGTWSQTQKIVASDQAPGTVYDPDHEDWNDRFGEGVAIWNDYVGIAAPFGGKGYMFERSGGSWSEVSILTYAEMSGFDRCIDVDIDSTTCIIATQTEDIGPDGEPYLMNSGGAAIFKRIDGTWDFAQRVVASDRSAGDHFGTSVSIDGDYFIVGAHHENDDVDGENEMNDAGSLYVFKINDDGDYIEESKIVASDRQIEDELGISCAISGSTFISGAFHQGYNVEGEDFVEEAGAAYTFTTLPDEPICEDVFISQSPTICEGDSFDVGDVSYDESGLYTDILTTVDGCDSVITTVLTVIESVSNTQSISLCYGESYTIGTSTYTETGSYTDILAAATGCDSIVTTELTIAAEINTTVEITGVTLSAVETGDISYQWIVCTTLSNIDGATEQTYEAEANGLYAVIITDGDCSDTSVCYTINSVGINENEANLTLSIYPNPTNGIITLSNPTPINGNISIINSLGKIIQTQNINGTTAMINLNNEAKGIYYIKVSSENGVSTKKITLQ